MASWSHVITERRHASGRRREDSMLRPINAALVASLIAASFFLGSQGSTPAQAGPDRWTLFAECLAELAYTESPLLFDARVKLCRASVSR